MRGATPYGLRGTALALPRGTLNNPSLRLGHDRTGLYRLPDGSVGLGLQQFEALKVAQAQSVVRATGSGTVVLPLRLTRSFPSTVDGQEVGLELYDGAVTAGLAVAYRETVANYGFRWYGRGGTIPGPHATPAMTLTPAKVLFVGNNIYAAGAVSSLPTTGEAQLISQAVAAGANAIVRLYTNNAAQGALLTLQGGSTGYGLTTVQGGASLYTTTAAPLILGTANAARLTIDGAGNASLRLPVSGAFRVLKSTDGSPVFQVTDAGASGLAPDSVFSGNIGPDSIGTSDIADGQITTAKLADGQVTTAKLALNAITAAQIAPGAITSAQIADGTIETADLHTNNISGEVLVRNAIHNNVQPVGGPAADFNCPADGVWRPIPQLERVFAAGSNPPDPNNWHHYFAFVTVSLSHSLGDRAMIRLAYWVSGTGAVTHIAQGSLASGGVAGGTTYPATSWFQATCLGVLQNTFTPGSYRVEVIGYGGGNVRVFANYGLLYLWEMFR